MTDNSTFPANDALTDEPLDLCATCGQRPRWGTLSRCVPCVQAAADADRQARAAAEASVNARRPGRPKGTDYRGPDRRKHEGMRHLIESGEVHCREKAAELVVEREGAYGSGSDESKV